MFCAALLNSHPMGFYAPAQIVRDARQHGVEVRPVCVNASRWDCTLEAIDEDRFAVRLGLRMVSELGNAAAANIVLARGSERFTSIEDLWRRSGAKSGALRRLAEADAFRPTMGLARREALWAIKALRDEPLPLFAAAAAREEALVPEIIETTVPLRPMSEGREVIEDYGHIGLSLRQHPLAFLRAELTAGKTISCEELQRTKDGRYVTVAGLVLVRQRPGSAKGVMFITIEDEGANANLIIWPSLFEQSRRIVMSARLLSVYGQVQREGDVIHVIAKRLTDLSPMLSKLGDRSAPFPGRLGRGDGAQNGGGPDPRSGKPPTPSPRDIYIPPLHLDEINVKARNFR